MFNPGPSDARGRARQTVVATAGGRLMLNVIGSVAQVEREVICEGVQRAKASTRAGSRPPVPRLRLAGEGVKREDIAKRLGVGLASDLSRARRRCGSASPSSPSGDPKDRKSNSEHYPRPRLWHAGRRRDRRRLELQGLRKARGYAAQAVRRQLVGIGGRAKLRRRPRREGIDKAGSALAIARPAGNRVDHQRLAEDGRNLVDRPARVGPLGEVGDEVGIHAERMPTCSMDQF